MSWRDRIAQTLIGAMRDIRPPREDLFDVARSNFSFGKVGRREMAPVDRLQGGVSTDPRELERVKRLADQMSGPGGYVERLIADDSGAIVEGQHRFDALRGLGAADVPVHRVIDLTRGYDTDAVRAAIREAGLRHPDQIHQLAGRAFDAAHQYGSPMGALAATELPPPYMGAYEAALRAMENR